MNTVDKNGSNGGRFIIPATGAVTGFKASIVEIREDGTTFSVFTNSLYPAGAGAGEDITTLTFAKGERIGGLTTAITVSAGRVHVIHAV
jgi:hypothetical protein